MPRFKIYPCRWGDLWNRHLPTFNGSYFIFYGRHRECDRKGSAETKRET